MSWDALIVKVAGDNYEKPTEHAKLVAMGNVRELRAAINEAFPGTKWDRSGDGFVQIESLGLEFRLIGKTASGKSSNAAQEDDKVQSIGVSARGTGNPVELITNFARKNLWSVADSQEGQWIDLKNVSDKSWREFTGYREQVFNAQPEPPSSELGHTGLNLVISVAFFAGLFLAVRYFTKP
jgi:hypothetical protein